MVQLTKQDWEKAKNIAEQEIKTAMQMLEINKSILEMVEAKISEYPDDKPKMVG